MFLLCLNGHSSTGQVIVIKSPVPIGIQNTNIKQLFEESYDKLKKMIETRICALIKLKQLPLEPDRELISEKARTILVSIV